MKWFSLFLFECGAGAEAMRFRFVPALLAHVNLLLVVSTPKPGSLPMLVVKGLNSKLQSISSWATVQVTESVITAC
ncbi:unnamed protein product [Arctia plantaginis]|uniref:Secreted protein n=1 Tax=Arctia plantaginis TaxID=874455 RepID=A0A8S0Z0S4_ARCPL|nr:unnamed protein product [Arctia plantaginis]